jgi:hypothetical protein
MTNFICTNQRSPVLNQQLGEHFDSVFNDELTKKRWTLSVSEFYRIYIVRTETQRKVESTIYSFQNEAAADCHYFYLQPKSNCI